MNTSPRLRALQAASACALADALAAWQARSFTPEEAEWIARVETRRELTGKLPGPFLQYGPLGVPKTPEEARERLANGTMKMLTLGEMSRKSSILYEWALLLFKLVRHFRPQSAVELGSCCGISGCYQAAAQRLNGGGELVTLERRAELCEVAQRNLQSLGFDHVSLVQGSFSDTLDGVLDSVPPIDYAFIDGHHDEFATVKYFEQFLPHLATPALIVFDDISWSPGMRRAWNLLRDHSWVKIAIDLKRLGITVIDQTITEKCVIE